MIREKMKKKFTAEQFTPTEHYSAEFKAKFANHFVRFVESGFKETLFPKWFYNKLHHCFGHIAHFDKPNFYAAQCSNLRARLGFLQQAVAWPCYGSPTHTFCDVERVLAQWIRDNNLIDGYRAAIAAATEIIERTELKRLKEKYPEEA